MTSDHPQFITIENLSDARTEIQKIGSDPKSIDIMAPKAVFKIIAVDQVVLQDAIIIKQDMPSLGGEVAIPREAFELQKNPATILIMMVAEENPPVCGVVVNSVKDSLCRCCAFLLSIASTFAAIKDP